jgi:transcriptional regulator with XRE-family HTH domain
VIFERFDHKKLNDEGDPMTSLAQRVRDFRYSKGWGPDELASRAEISRTALYQIESGKTGLPRAGTLRRIAVALDVSMDELLGHADAPHLGPKQGRSPLDHANPLRRSRDLGDWIPAEGGPLVLPSHPPYPGQPQSVAAREDGRGDEQRSSLDPHRARPNTAAEAFLVREGELLSKLHDLLHSPLGHGIARIIDELHQMLPRARSLA